MKRTTLLPPTPRERLAFGLALLWMGLVLFHYFPAAAFLDFSFLTPLASDLRHLDPRGLAANIPGFLKTVFVSFAALFTLWRWGRKGRLWLGLPGGNPALRFCLEAALGMLFFNGLWLGLGMNVLWRAPLLGALAVLFFGLALWDLLARPPAFQKFPRFKNPGKGGWILAGLGAAVFLLGLAQSLVPEVYYDALVYHLSTLQFWQYHHGIADFSTNLYSYYPFGAELYLMNGFFFQGGESAKMLSTLAVLLCALAAAGWVAEETGLFEGCLVWAMVWAFPFTSSSAWACQNDALLAFFVLLFLRELWRWGSEPGNGQRALAAGLWAGAALSIKYTAVLWVLLPLGLSVAGRGLFKGKKETGFLLGALGLLAVPWFLKNWAYTGNGFYPYFSSWMGGRGLTPRGLQALMADHEAAFENGFHPGAWLLQVASGDLDRTIGPFLFCFLPFLFLPGRRPRVAKFLGVTGGLLLLAGFLATHQLRLLMPAFLVCFAAMAAVLGGIKAGAWVRAWGGLTAVLVLWSLLTLLRRSVDYYQSDRVWLGLQTPEAYLEGNPQTSTYFDLTRAVGRLLPEGDCVLVAGDARGLYYPRPFYTNSAFDEPLLVRLALAEEDGEGIGRRLREMGIDDLAVSGLEGVRVSDLYHAYDMPPQAWERLDDFIRRFTDPVYLNGRNGIYRLHPSPGGGKAPFPDLLLLFRDGPGAPAVKQRG